MRSHHCLRVRFFSFALCLTLLLSVSVRAEAMTMTLHGTGFDASGNALGNGGVDGSWTVTSQYGTTAYAITSASPDWYSGWLANSDTNGFNGSGWINDSYTASNGGNSPMPVYSMSFSLSSFQLSSVSIAGYYAWDDAYTMSINGNVVASAPYSGGALNAFSIINTSWLNQGLNTVTIAETGTDNNMEGIRFQGVVTGLALPEPPGVLLLLAGFALTGAVSRGKTRRRA